MKDIIIICIFSIISICTNGQKFHYSLLSDSIVNVERCNINNVNNFPTKTIITTTSVKIIGDTSEYYIELYQRILNDCSDCGYRDSKKNIYTSEINNNRLVLKLNEVEKFKDIINKYFEWYNLSKSKSIQLSKIIYQSNNSGNTYGSHDVIINYLFPNTNKIEYKVYHDIDYYQNLNRSNTRELIKTQYTDTLAVLFDIDKLIFSSYNKTEKHFSDGNKETTINDNIEIVLSYKNLLRLKKLIDNGTYDSQIKKMKEVNKVWDEFDKVE